jgi:hypothetical protein
LNAIRSRIRHSFEDPRPDLGEDEANAALEAVLAKVDEDLDRAAF